MNAFLSVLEENDIKKDSLTRGQLTTLQVNLGDLCNQSCVHCHINASPAGTKIMSKEVIDDILRFLARTKIRTLDITGGAPELNPHFDYLMTSARPLVPEIIVRSNLTVFFEPGKEYLPAFLKKNHVHLICSLPCYTKENVDKQRGQGVFEKSIKALTLLNELGFSKGNGLRLDLVYNPMGANLPGPQDKLEQDYKKALKENYRIEFDRLLTITNVPIEKFKNYLDGNDENEHYYELLKKSFNPATLEGLMCRSFLSIGFDGRLYDCDFNLALGLAMKGPKGAFLTLRDLRPEDLEGREIMTGEHCLSCTAGSGSSCQGALASSEGKIAGLCTSAAEDAKSAVKEYYGKILRSKQDLKTSACCSADSFPEPQRSILAMIEPEILEKFYGCGSPIPSCLEGCRVLDLGSGTGRDVYLAAKLVGEEGFVTGVDMTDEQLEIARKHEKTQMKKFGFKRCNVDFKKGYIEDLREAGIEDNSQDVVISNCVINLSPDKKSVFSEIFRVLKPGGELYFSDVFADRRIPDEVRKDPVLYGECLGGAMYIEDFRRLLRELGCLDYRVMSQRKIAISDPAIIDKVGQITFCSMTVRAFKLDLEDLCEDFSQVAYYQGTIPNHPHRFQLDDHHIFITNKPMLVCGNTASMLSDTRYGKHFKITGDISRHFGPFSCGQVPKVSDSADPCSAGSCC
jgi:radical SAM/Cys-rich protein